MARGDPAAGGSIPPIETHLWGWAIHLLDETQCDDQRIHELFEVVIILLVLSDMNVTQVKSLLNAYDSMGVRVPPPTPPRSVRNVNSQTPS